MWRRCGQVWTGGKEREGKVLKILIFVFCVAVVGWMSHYFGIMGEVMPNSEKIALPCGQTKSDVLEMCREDGVDIQKSTFYYL